MEDDPRRQKAMELYIQGVGQREIARRLHAGTLTVRGWLRDLLDKEIADRSEKIRRAKPLYDQGMTVSEVADELGISHVIVRRLIGKVRPVPSGKDSPHWKGGSRRTRRTYSREAARDLEIPRVCEQCGSTDGLVVHHRNGNIADNCRENLQMLCRSCHAKLHRVDPRL